VVVRDLDELLDVVVPLLGQLDDLVNVLVASVLVLLRCEATTDCLGLGQLLSLLHRQCSDTSLESEGLEETTALEFGVLVELAAGQALLGSSRGSCDSSTTATAGRRRQWRGRANGASAEVVAETAVGVGPWVVDITLGRHLAKFTAVRVAVNWVGVATCTVGVVRVVWVLCVVGVVRVLQVVLLVGVVGVRTSASSNRTGSTAGQAGATNNRRLGYRTSTCTCGSTSIGDDTAGGSIRATGEEVGVRVPASGKSRDGSGEESDESKRGLGRHVDDDLN
jgi:hypothetical protein